ncbi:MAG: micrococcal nuclease [Acidimicrobiales bacterium]|jgi:micrococcal nuclease
MTRTFIGAMITLLLAGGASGYGYKVIRDNKADIFENSVHEILYVVDGDTLDVENEVRIRLLGIDAPEKGTCYYSESHIYLQELVNGVNVRLEKDISGADRYDRLLRYIYVPSNDIREDDVFINETMLREGYAKVLAIAPDNRYRDLFSSAQEEAKKDARGLWGACEQEDEVSLREVDSGPNNPSCTIKGNISEKAYGRNYFTEGCPNYNRIKIDTRKGEAYFCTEKEAEEAGFIRSASCSNTF